MPEPELSRKQSATIDLKVRMKEPLRAKIESAAKIRGVSLNAEIVRRVEASFNSDDINQIILKTVRETIRLLRGNK